MPKDSFSFKQFNIQQDKCAMKVGTDGVLLGAWANVSRLTAAEEGTISILDIGAGTGIISLMLAQRMSETGKSFQIDAIEIDATAAAQAQENIDASPWPRNITIWPMSMQAFERKKILKSYDLIVSNPPFYNATLKPEDEGRAIARHKDSLPIADIAKFAKNRLSDHGRLALIYPTTYDSEVVTAVILCGLHPVRICDILTKEGKPCKRRMVEFSAENTPIRKEQLSIRDKNGKYTDEYRTLTNDFYLHLSD